MVRRGFSPFACVFTRADKTDQNGWRFFPLAMEERQQRLWMKKESFYWGGRGESSPYGDNRNSPDMLISDWARKVWPHGASAATPEK